jgi:hypothetical protein
MHQRYIEEIDRAVENQARRARRVPLDFLIGRLMEAMVEAHITDHDAAHAFGPSHDRGGTGRSTRLCLALGSAAFRSTPGRLSEASAPQLSSFSKTFWIGASI